MRKICAQSKYNLRAIILMSAVWKKESRISFQFTTHGKTETVKLEMQDTVLITSRGAAARTCGERREDIKSACFML